MFVNLSEPHKTQHELSHEREKGITEMRRVISSWNKSQLKAYVYNNNRKYPSTDAGMAAILQRFIHTNEFQIGDMSEELKLGFDIVRAISKNSKICFQTTDLIYEFIKYYHEVIVFYDRQSVQTYYHKLLRDYEQSIRMVKKKLEIEKELRAGY